MDDFASSLEQAIYDAMRALQRSQDVRASFRQAQRDHWERHVGGHLAEMLDTREGAEGFLAHDNPKVRTIAIDILSSQWPADGRLAISCERLAFSDPDPAVREVAIIVLGICDPVETARVGALLAAIIHNPQHATQFRVSAYLTLEQIYKRKRFRELLITNPLGVCRFPDNIDWDFVDRVLFGIEKTGDLMT